MSRLLSRYFCRSLHKSVPVNKHRRPLEGPFPPATATSREGGYKLYKYIALFGAIPFIIVAEVLYFVQPKPEEERPPFVKYRYMYIRTKRFPWGDDGQKSLFHNPKVNPLPDGYEDEK